MLETLGLEIAVKGAILSRWCLLSSHTSCFYLLSFCRMSLQELFRAVWAAEEEKLVALLDEGADLMMKSVCPPFFVPNQDVSFVNNSMAGLM